VRCRSPCVLTTKRFARARSDRPTRPKGAPHGAEGGAKRRPDDRAPPSPPKGAARTRAKRALLRSSPTGAKRRPFGSPERRRPTRMGGPYLTRQGVGFHPVASVCFLK